MFNRLKRLSLTATISKSPTVADASPRPSVSHNAESAPTIPSATVTKPSPEAAEPPKSLDSDVSSGVAEGHDAPVPTAADRGDMKDDENEVAEEGGKGDVDAEAKGDDAPAKHPAAPTPTTVNPVHEATVTETKDNDEHVAEMVPQTPALSAIGTSSAEGTEVSSFPHTSKRPGATRTVSTNALDGHSPLPPAASAPAQPASTKPAASPTSPVSAKRLSTGNVFARLLSVDWAIEKQTTTTATPSGRAERSAYVSAIQIRSFIVGSSALAAHQPAPLSKSDIKKLRESLLKPEEAKRIVASLRTLPSHPDHDKLLAKAGKPALPAPPVHAACLSVTDEEAESMHFSKLLAINPLNSAQPVPSTTKPSGSAVKATATAVQLPVPTAQSTDKPKSEHEVAEDEAAKLAAKLPVLSPVALESAFVSMNLVSLVTAPDLGLGHPTTDPGIFAGAVPSAQEIGNGVEEVGRTLIALGFAGSGMVWPDHTGVYPPTDRMSCYTYWWGFELVLPHKSVGYLSKCKSVSNAMLDFLTALALFQEGVREILPFVRYISQFVDMEFDAIKQQDRDKGVVCAATWLIPVALVPRPWDFPPRPANLPATAAVPKPILSSTTSVAIVASASSTSTAGPAASPALPPSSTTMAPAPAPSMTVLLSSTSAGAATPSPSGDHVQPIAISPAAAQLAISSLTLGSSAAAPSAAALLSGIAPVPTTAH